MSTFVFVNTYTHSVTFVTDKMLMSLKKIIAWSGLDPARLANDWDTLDRGIKTWLGTRHLEQVSLEVYRVGTHDLVGRWDFDIRYGSNRDGVDEMWIDTEAIRHAIKKCGLDSSRCDYRIVATTKAGRPDVDGWRGTTLLSTNGLVRHSVGTTIGANPLATRTAYWRKP